MEVKKKIKAVISGILLGVLAVATAVMADADHEIEQVYINMPEVTAYYRGTSDDQPDAYLDGEKLSLTSDTVFSESKETVEYYVLVDVSASIRATRFENIKSSLSQFVQDIRKKDKLILMTFGDQTEVKLDGSQSREDAENVISQLENKDQNTVFFDAISQVTDMINTAAAGSRMRRVVVIISDGKDCSDNTRNMESVEKNLMSNGIPVYSVAVENNQGDSEEQISDYQGKFSALARNTGGLPWTASSEEKSVYEALDTIQNSILNSYRAVFRSSSNQVSNKTEEFVLNFNDAADSKDTYSVMVSRSQKDETAPTVTITAGSEQNELNVAYSEPVKNAEDVSNYTLKEEDKIIPLKQIVKDKNAENSYYLVFDQDLYNGEYSVEIENITDCSNEGNALQNKTQTLNITDNGEKPKESVMDKVLKWWPVPLSILVLILVIVLVVQHRKKKGLTIIDGEVIDEGDIEKHIHVISGKSASDRPCAKLVIWMSNGSSEPKKIEYELDGSAIVGRSSKCDIYCDDPMMSRQHFVLEIDGNNLYVSDLETVNGTNVNGVRISGRYKLTSYDEITAGNIKFRIQW